MKVKQEHSPRPFQQASHSNVVTSVAFSPDGEILASGSWDGTVKLWDLGGGKLKLRRTLAGDWDEVEGIAFSPDGRKIAVLGTGWDGAPLGIVMIWDLRTWLNRPFLRIRGKLDALAFSPDGEALATVGADCRAVTLWDVATGQERARLADHRGPVWSVAFSPDGETLAAASGVVPAVADRGDANRVGEIRIWDLAGPEPAPRANLVGHEYGIVSVCFSPDGETLATGGFDRAVKLWDASTGRERANLDGHVGWVAAVAFSPDGEILATGSHDQAVKLWDASTGQELANLSGHTGNVYSVCFSPDGAALASGSLDGSVKLWDVAKVAGPKCGV